MSTHLKKTLVGILGGAIIFGVAALADPGVAHFIAAHPAVDAVVGVVLGLARALDQALTGSPSAATKP